MNFFKREHRLSHLIRSADPLASAPAPHASAPRRLWLALPLLATAALPLLLAHRPQTELTKVLPPIRVAHLLPTPSPTPQVAPHAAPKRAATASKPLVKHPRRVATKVYASTKKRKAQAKEFLAQAQSSVGGIKSSLAVAKNDLGEALVISVRPITPDELRQELQTP